MTDQEIISRLSLTKMPNAVQKQALEQINEVVELRVAGIIDDSMSDVQKQAFMQMTSKSPEVVMQWLSSELTDVANLYEAALQDYLEELSAKNGLGSSVNDSLKQ